MINKKKIEELALERIEELDKDLFIVEISISASNSIRVEIDSASGNVAIEDCISVSRNIEHNLDREEQDFELQVSSPGLDKPFRVVQQYKKNVGREVKLTPVNGVKLEGVLKSADDNGVVIETTRKERLEGKKKKVTVVEEHPFNYDEIKETKIVITFK
ncbi:MAG: ribosome assembly cofactor RimP [Crocinitomicaceae bacterium]|nr:ribosome assembly cofactor RimP [Crocinitomicaceae bacterium]